MNKILLIIIFNLGAAFCSAQVYFNQAYNDTNFLSESSTNILILGDQSFLLPGVYTPNQEELAVGFGIRSINELGEVVEFNSIVSPQNFVIYPNLSDAFIHTSDGGYLQSTAKGGGYLLKLNSDLTIHWELTVDSITTFYRAVELTNGNIFVCGFTYATNHINLFWISPDGAVLNHGYADPYPLGDFYQIGRIIELSNGDLLFNGGWTTGFSNNQMMFRTDSAGVIEWQKQWNYDYQDWIQYPVIESPSTATSVFGHIDTVLNPGDIARDNFRGRLGTMEVDLMTGDTSNVILYEPELAWYWLTDFTKTPDNGYAALGYAVSLEHTVIYSFITKLNENRQFEWHKKYLHESEELDSTQFAFASDFEVTADSGFVVAGHWDDIEMLGKQMPWVFKVDRCGDLVWSNCGADNVSHAELGLTSLHVWPNPASNMVNMTSKQEFESITIRDITGRIVYTSAMNNHVLQFQIDVSMLQNGLYLLEVDFGNRVVAVQRLVVE